ncbi:universal stress protein [Paraburkholderia sp. EG304]|uniref:universal stress protein n=1 Tax=Paraburkholderia sp. EG304 TaxID=3237015 RepID=UPI00397A11EA
MRVTKKSRIAWHGRPSSGVMSRTATNGSSGADPHDRGVPSAGETRCAVKRDRPRIPLTCVNATVVCLHRLGSVTCEDTFVHADGVNEMNYRNLLVHLDDSLAAQQRLDIALRIARQFDAQLVGLDIASIQDAHMVFAIPGAAGMYAEMIRQSDQRRAALRDSFDAACGHANVAGQFRCSDASDKRSIVRYARLADLVIAGQSNPNAPETYIHNHCGEQLLMTAGRPVLFVPYTGIFPSVGSRILIAWDGSREATRTIHDALPFISRAQRNIIVTVHGPADAPLAARIPGADMPRTLARHDAVIDVVELEGATGARAGSMLLSCAQNHGSDLIVMGGYGHARWREAVWGGVTHTLLQSMAVPVLMSN